MGENTASLYSLSTTLSADRGAGPAAAMSEAKGAADGGTSLLKEKEQSREIPLNADSEVGVEVEMAAVADEDEPATAGEWHNGEVNQTKGLNTVCFRALGAVCRAIIIAIC